MKCPNCDTTVENNWLICPNCGLDLSPGDSGPSSRNHVKSTVQERVVKTHNKSANKPSSNKIWLGLAVITSLGIAMFSIASEQITYQKERQATETKQAHYLFATTTKQKQYERATETKQTQNKHATATKLAQIENVTATSESIISLVLKDISRKFPVVHYFDMFEDGNRWITGFVENNQIEIRTGKLVINHLNANALVFEEVPQSRLRNFYFQVDVMLTEGTLESSCYGIAYRWQTNPNSMYIFYICDNKTYTVYFWSESSGYENITPDLTFEDSIRPREFNQLGVLADGQDIELFINDKPIYSYTDKKITGTGTISLTTVLYDGQKASFEFDNLIMLKK
jgi:hypothetical protein